MRKLAGHFTQTTVMTFHDLGLDESILKSIDEFGFTTPTPIQAGSIPHIIEGKDVIGSAQTGTGKTAAYALPILHRLGGHKKGAPPRCLVLGPTRELAAQVEDQFASYGKYCAPKCCLIHGGVGYGKQLDELRAGADVVIATPGNRFLGPRPAGRLRPHIMFSSSGRGRPAGRNFGATAIASRRQKS